MATPSRNGNRPNRVPFYGFMASVRLFVTIALTLFADPHGFTFCSGRWKKCSLVCSSYCYLSLPLEFMLSFASSAIIQDVDALRRSGLASLAFFYCDFREDQKKDLRGLLSSVLVQLCYQSDTYSDILLNLYMTHLCGVQNPSDDALVRCLKDILKYPGQAPIYLIIDALDECPNTSALPSPREKVLSLVEELINLEISNLLRICVTSRPEMDIKNVLDPLTSHSVSLHDERGQMQAIDSYIRSVINMHPKNRRWKAEDKQLVIDVLTERADGM